MDIRSAVMLIMILACCAVLCWGGWLALGKHDKNGPTLIWIGIVIGIVTAITGNLWSVPLSSQSLPPVQTASQVQAMTRETEMLARLDGKLCRVLASGDRWAMAPMAYREDDMPQTRIIFRVVGEARGQQHADFLTSDYSGHATGRFLACGDTFTVVRLEKPLTSGQPSWARYVRFMRSE